MTFDLGPIERACRAAFPLAARGVRVELVRASVEGGLWLTLACEAREEGRAPWDCEAALLLVDERELTDPRVPAYVDGWLAALSRAVHARDPQARFSFAAIDVRMPVDCVPAADAAAFERALLQAKWLGALLPAGARTPQPPYEPAPPALARRPDGGLDVDAVCLWVSRQWQPSFTDHAADARAFAAVPAAPRAVWILWHLENDVLHNGLASFVLQASAWRIAAALRALDDAGARRFARLLRGATSAGLASSEAAHEPAPARAALYAALEAGAAAPLRALDDADGHEEGRSFHLVDADLRPALARYVTAHEGELVRARAQRRGVVVRKR